MKYAIAYSIDTVEELERVKRKEAEALTIARTSAITSAALSTPPLLDADFVSF